MNIFSKLIGGVATLISYKRKDFLFERSKKHIVSWGEHTYGKPTILRYDGESTLSVGRYCSFADRVSILLGANHKRGVVPTFPYSKIDPDAGFGKTNDRGDIIIGNDVWIGYGATLIGPITIGDGAIIGAGAVVVRDVPAFAVVGGVPAKILKFRFTEEEMKALQKIAWWNWDLEKAKKYSASLFTSEPAAFIAEFISKI